MNNTLSTAPGRQAHPPEPSFEDNPVIMRHVGVLDRIALHAGIALIKWGRRPHAIASRERRATRVEQRLAQLDRERGNERTLRLTLPPR